MRIRAVGIYLHSVAFYCLFVVATVLYMRRAARGIPNNLRQYRELMGYTQRQVAYLLGFTTHASVSEWEVGITKPSLDFLLQLSIIYKTLPDELYPELRRRFVQKIDKRQKLLEAGRDVGG